MVSLSPPFFTIKISYFNGFVFLYLKYVYDEK